MARALPQRLSGHGRRGHARPLLPRQRRRLDSQLDRGSGIPWEGNYSSWLDQKQQRLALEEKAESKRQRTLERELEWIRMSPRARQAKGKARLNAYEQLLNEDTAQKIDRSRSTFRRAPASATSSSKRAACARATATCC